MKRIWTFCALPLACLAWSAVGAEGSTNKIVTPPEETLAETLKTDLPGAFRISPAWTGQCSVVHATGAFTAGEAPVHATNRYKLKFDLVVVAPRNPVGHVGPKAVAMHDTNGGYRALHSIRDPLPSDIAIKAAATRSALEKLLGPAQGFPEATGYGPSARTRLTWSLVAAREKIIETLQVNAAVEKRPGSGEPRVESLEILRGTARPEIKASKKT